MSLVLVAFIYVLPKWIWFMESSWKSKGILGRQNLTAENVILGQGPPFVRRVTKCFTEAPTEAQTLLEGLVLLPLTGMLERNTVN